MANLIIGDSRKHRLRRLTKRLFMASSAILLSLLLIYSAFRQWTAISLPKDDGPLLQSGLQSTESENVLRLSLADNNWLEYHDGIYRLNLVGDARVMGHAHGILTRASIQAVEEDLLNLVNKYVLPPQHAWLNENILRWRYRNLPEAIPPSMFVELASFSRALLEENTHRWEPFHRFVYFHALPELTDQLEQMPLLYGFAFAVWGKQSTDGRLIVGRSLNIDEAPSLDREKAVIAFHPAGKIPFVSMAWPSMIGVVTGVNAQQIFVSLNHGKIDQTASTNSITPGGFIAREILETATDIKSAMAVLKKHTPLVAMSFLIADGKAPEAIVAEVTPSGLAIRRSNNQIISTTNHLLDNKFKADARNDWMRRYTTSEAHYRRLSQLLARFGGKIDVKTAVMILRNRAGQDDQPLALGHRLALDAMLSAQGVALDLQDMILYVARGPHMLGAFVPVDLRPLLGIPSENVNEQEKVAADPLLESTWWKKFQLAQENLHHARALQKVGAKTQALEYAYLASQILPDWPDAQIVTADLLWEQNRREEARSFYKKFIKIIPTDLQSAERAQSRSE